MSGKQRKPTPQETNIQVAVRCRYKRPNGRTFNKCICFRPRNVSEKKTGSSSIIECQSKKGEIHVALEKLGSKTFTFDKVFGPESKQISVYKAIASPLIDEVLTGYNCTVFA